MSKIDDLINKLCPNGVEFKDLGEVFIIKNGYTPSKNNNEYWNNGNIPWFRMEDIRTNGKILNNSIQHITEKAIKGHLFPKNSLMVATTATIGVHALITEDFLCNQQLTAVTIKNEYTKKLNIKYCFYYFDIIDKQCIKIANQGGGMPIVSLEKMKKLKIAVPPLEVQDEIVHVLDDFTLLSAELSEKLSAELKARQQQFSYYREELITNSKGKRYKLDDVVDIYLGLTHTPKYVENGVKFISAQNTSNDYLDLENVKYISREEFESITSNAKPKRNDVLFTRVGSNLGHPVIVETDEELCIFVSLGFLRVKDNNLLSNKFLKHWINTEDFWRQVRKNVHGSAKVNLNTGWLRNFEINIPAMEKQQKIIEIMDKLERISNSITEGIPAEIEARQKQYEYYRDKLLTFKELEVNEEQ